MNVFVKKILFNYFLEISTEYFSLTINSIETYKLPIVPQKLPINNYSFLF